MRIDMYIESKRETRWKSKKTGRNRILRLCQFYDSMLLSVKISLAIIPHKSYLLCLLRVTIALLIIKIEGRVLIIII